MGKSCKPAGKNPPTIHLQGCFPMFSITQQWGELREECMYKVFWESVLATRQLVNMYNLMNSFEKGANCVPLFKSV